MRKKRGLLRLGVIVAVMTALSVSSVAVYKVAKHNSEGVEIAKAGLPSLPGKRVSVLKVRPLAQELATEPEGTPQEWRCFRIRDAHAEPVKVCGVPKKGALFTLGVIATYSGVSIKTPGATSIGIFALVDPRVSSVSVDNSSVKSIEYVDVVRLPNSDFVALVALVNCTTTACQPHLSVTASQGSAEVLINPNEPIDRSIELVDSE